MAVKFEEIEVGAVFRFKGLLRKVVRIEKRSEKLHDSNVIWEYANGESYAGKTGGVMWLTYFRRLAAERVADPTKNGGVVGEWEAFMPYDLETKVGFVNAIGSSEQEARENLKYLDLTDEQLGRIHITGVMIKPMLPRLSFLDSM